MKRSNNKKGFTIIEITLAMAFLAILMVTIISIILSITDIYHKGLAIRSVNSIGTQIIEDITRTVNSSMAAADVFDADSDGDGNISFDENLTSFQGYFYERIQNVPKTERGLAVKSNNGNGNGNANGNSDRAQTFGVFCTGTYSYVWNNAAVLNDETGKIHGIKIVGYPDKGDYYPKLLRIYDDEQKLCRSANFDTRNNNNNASSNSNGNPNAAYKNYLWDSMTSDDIIIGLDSNYSIYVANDEKSGLFDDSDKKPVETRTVKQKQIYSGYVVDLINDDEIDLALYEMKILPASQSAMSREAYFTGSFILATRSGGVDINSNNDFCRTNLEADTAASTEYTESNFSYCAVNKFNFSARTGGNSITNF